jgi:hypothetical protein
MWFSANADTADAGMIPRRNSTVCGSSPSPVFAAAGAGPGGRGRGGRPRAPPPRGPPLPGAAAPGAHAP